MAIGIENYISKTLQDNVKLIGTDIKDRGFFKSSWDLYYNLDFFADDYPIDKADWIIMNPPYSVIEPFLIRSLEIADCGIVMLARLQFLEVQDAMKKF